MKSTLRYSILLLLTIVLIWMSLDMAGLTGREMLWGYRPLPLFLAGWGTLIFLLGDRFSRYGKTWRRLGLSTLSGIILAVGFPGILLPLPFLMFVGFVPLLIVEKEIAAEREKASRWEVYKFAYHAFIVWNIITTFWVANTALVAGIFAIAANSALMGIPFVLFHQTRKTLPRFGYAPFILYWIAFEYGHLNWELTWPWLTLGNSFAEWPSLVQWYEYTGVFGGGLWILGLNLLFFKAWEKFQAGDLIRYDLLRIAVIFILPQAISLAIYTGYKQSGDTVEVVVVQPNYEPHYEKFTISEQDQTRRLLELTASQLNDDTDYLLFPETVFGTFSLINTADAGAHQEIAQIRSFLRNYPGVELVSGINAYTIIGPGQRSRATREGRSRDGSAFSYEVLNAAVQMDPQTGELQWYRKSKLVPGPEIFPYPKVFFMFKALVDVLEGTVAGVGTQPERSVFAGPAAKIAPVICYESVFGEYFTGYIRKGAQAVFIMTNDGWWDDTPGHRQHLYFAGLRAIETRRSIARAANTGISAFINQKGEIRQPTAYGEAIAIRDKIALNDAVTFYVQWGDIIARLALFATALLLLNTLTKGIVGRGGKQATG